MDSLLNKVISSIIGLLSVAITTVLFFFLLNIIDIRMLKAGYLEGSGVGQFLRVYLGIPALILLAISWLGFVMYVFHYYSRSENLKILIKRFTKITSIQMYIVPVALIIFLLAFGLSPTFSELIIMVSAVVLATASYIVYRRLKSPVDNH